VTILKPPRPAQSSAPRLLPALMVTLGVMLSLKAVAVAEAANGATTGQSAPAPTPSPTAPAPSGAPAPTATQTKAPENGPTCPGGIAAAAGLSPAEVQVLTSLGERRKQIEAREAALTAKADLATAAERRLNERLEELKKLEERVQTLLGEVDEEQARRLTTLVDVYQRMRAKDAAAVFNELDDEILVQVASRMRQQNLAEIMAKMTPDRARALTVKLAEARLPPPDATPPARPSSGAAPKAAPKAR
jgi:flagellar motility protein MotE (MotC chaperone)